MTIDSGPRGAQLLVVEDDASVAATLVRGLTAAGFAVELAVDGELARDALARGRFDAVVLDLKLPRVRGEALIPDCIERDLPVVVLTAAADLGTRLGCFQRGAADFLSKPFFMEELVARLRARLRATDGRDRIAWDDVVLSLPERRVTRGGAVVALTRNELDMLVYLARRPGRAISRRTLAEAALSSNDTPSERTIDSHVAHLRKKLGEAARAIQTVWGFGYRFVRKDDA